MRHSIVWISAGLLALSVTACGGSATEEASGGAGGAAGGAAGAAGTGGGAAGAGGHYVGGCPETAPTGGTSCPTQGLQCTYGDHFDPYCRQVFTCNDQGKWGVSPKPKGPSCTPEQPEGCPKTKPAASTECDKKYADQFLTCEYPDERSRCSCSAMDCSGGPCQQIDPPAWVCHGPPADPKCPADMPNVGTACSATDLKCPYMGGGCAGGWTLQCKDGAWTLLNEPCPV